MPNWCANLLVVTNSEEFENTLGTPNMYGETVNFSFHQTVPFPENGYKGMLGDEERRDCAEKGIPNWYDWCCREWGTKWDASDVVVDRCPKLEIRFETAWSPPMAWLKSVSLKFPKSKFTLMCCESGMAFYGTIIAKNGKLQDNTKNGSHSDLVKFANKHRIGLGG